MSGWDSLCPMSGGGGGSRRNGLNSGLKVEGAAPEERNGQVWTLCRLRAQRT